MSISIGMMACGQYGQVCPHSTPIQRPVSNSPNLTANIWSKSVTPVRLARPLPFLAKNRSAASQLGVCEEAGFPIGFGMEAASTSFLLGAGANPGKYVQSFSTLSEAGGTASLRMAAGLLDVKSLMSYAHV